MVWKRRWASRSPPLPRVSKEKEPRKCWPPLWQESFPRAPLRGRSKTRARPQPGAAAAGNPSHHLARNPEADADCAARPGLRFRVGQSHSLRFARRRSAPPRPRAPDLGRWRQSGRSRGHMAEGDAGSDQRQVRPRRGAGL